MIQNLMSLKRLSHSKHLMLLTMVGILKISSLLKNPKLPNWEYQRPTARK